MSEKSDQYPVLLTVIVQVRQTASIGNMTFNTAPSPLVSSSSSVISGSYAAWRGFGTAGPYVACTGATGHVTIDLGVGNEILPNHLYWNKGHPSNHYPVDFTLLGSVPGDFTGEETIFKSVTGQGIGPWTHSW